MRLGILVCEYAPPQNLGDDIEERCPRGSPITVRCEVARHEARIDAPALASWRPRQLGARFERAFGRRVGGA
jgi:hypothetical protein